MLRSSAPNVRSADSKFLRVQLGILQDGNSYSAAGVDCRQPRGWSSTPCRPLVALAGLAVGSPLTLLGRLIGLICLCVSTAQQVPSLAAEGQARAEHPHSLPSTAHWPSLHPKRQQLDQHSQAASASSRVQQATLTSAAGKRAGTIAATQCSGLQPRCAGNAGSRAFDASWSRQQKR